MSPLKVGGTVSFCSVCAGVKKPILFISSRIHPNETHASYLFLGLLSFLLSEAAEAQLLRLLFSVAAVPMNNPDGVVGGLSRSCLHAEDLNRVWLSPSKALHPTVSSAKQLLIHLKQNKQTPLLFLDIHSHSLKPNIFL